MTVLHGTFKNEILDEKIKRLRGERYACQSVAKMAIPDQRVSFCLSNLVGDYVQVWEHLKTRKTFYNGLMVCGSVWTCPVCAAKISERRKKELENAFALHKASGGQIALLTLTFSHKKTDKLQDLVDTFGQATQKFFAGRESQKIRSDMGLIGRVRVFEITYGANGFHPHVHIALFYNASVDLDSVKERMYIYWNKVCCRVGLKSSKKHGLDLQSGEHAEAYLNKHGSWSLEQELSKAHIKTAKLDSMTPFDFLRRYLATGEDKYLKLFREYARVFKGKRQLSWSAGLKAHFAINEKSDEELAKEKLEDADLLGLINFEQWKIIRSHENRALLLDNVEKHGFELGLKITLNTNKKDKLSRHDNLT